MCSKKYVGKYLILEESHWVIVSHTCVGNVVEKRYGEDMPEWELDWLLYLE